MHWLTRAEVREVSNAAQTIYDDIRHGRLIIHAHAHDGWTTVAIGTYLDGGPSPCTARTTCAPSPTDSNPPHRPSPPSNASTATPYAPDPPP
ncbi:hypothetical protein [Streptomyces stelliscabiei]|uniref:hypothetical protein n=1 Tax=Streptomyces stelliscabiei TaxID=146820 RepID=UPI002FF2E469